MTQNTSMQNVNRCHQTAKIQVIEIWFNNGPLEDLPEVHRFNEVYYQSLQENIRLTIHTRFKACKVPYYNQISSS